MGPLDLSGFDRLEFFSLFFLVALAPRLLPRGLTVLKWGRGRAHNAMRISYAHALEAAKTRSARRTREDLSTPAA